VSQKLKLLFDECVGKPILSAVAGFLATSEQKPELSHILDFQEQGTPDSTWIPQVEAEGWIIITADRDKRCKEEKLPLVCRQFGITHIMLSARVHHKKNFEKACLILEVWSDVAGLIMEPRGSGFSLRLTQGGHANLVKLYGPLPK
jgi:hypothetical protein